MTSFRSLLLSFVALAFSFALSVHAGDAGEPAAGASGMPMPRVAHLRGQMPYVEGQHAIDHQFRALADDLHWPVAAFSVTDIDRLIQQRDRFDLILVGREHNAYTKADFLKHRAAWLDFMQQGGTLVVDNVRPDSPHDWPLQLQRDWALPAGADLPANAAQQSDARLTFPNPITAGTSDLPTINGWQILRTDAAGHVLLACRAVGSGLLLINRSVSDSRLVENLWTQQITERIAGVTFTDAVYPNYLPGRASLHWQTQGSARLPLEAFVSVDGEDHAAATRIESGRSAVAVTIPDTGSDTLRLRIAAGGHTIVDHTRSAQSPPLCQMTLERDYLTQPRDIEALVLLQSASPRADLQLRWSLRDEAAVVASDTVALSLGADETRREFRVSLPTADLALGRYVWDATLTDAAGRELSTRRVVLDRTEPATPPHTAIIRDDGVLVVDGEPTLPIGFYRVDTADLERLAATPVNITVGVSGYPHHGIRPHTGTNEVARAQQLGLHQLVMTNWYFADRLLGDPREALAQHWRHELPRLAAQRPIVGIYLMDEPMPPMMPKVAQGYRLLKEIVPEMPVVVTLHRAIEDFDAFRAAEPFCDILNVDNYPWPYREPTELAHAVDRARQIMAGRGAVWATLQNFRYSTDPSAGPLAEFPSIDWLRCTAYLAMTHGAKGLLGFALRFLDDGLMIDNHPDAWADTLSVLNEIHELQPVFLADEQIVGGSDPTGIHWFAALHNNHYYLVAVNGEKRPLPLTLQLSPFAGRKGATRFGGDSVTLDAAGRLNHTFASLARQVFVFPADQLIEPTWRTQP